MNKGLIIGIVILVIIGVGIGSFILFNKKVLPSPSPPGPTPPGPTPPGPTPTPTPTPTPSECKFSDIWTNWTLCTSLCNGGTQLRKKVVISGGIDCEDIIDEQKCNEQSCNDFQNGIVILRTKD